MSTTLYQFTGETLGPLEWCGSTGTTTLVADSWRVEDGHAVALDLHLERFRASALQHSDVAEATLDKFYGEVIDHIPRTGSWFPRIELVATAGGPTLRYRERVAPAWSTEVVVGVASHDPRTTPTIKGPDLEALLALRSALGDPTSTEALIMSPAGFLIEGAYSSIIIWPEHSDEMVIAPRTPPRIPGITEAVLLDVAAANGVSVHQRALSLDDLERAEVWVLSALHGIRLATRFLHGPELRSDPTRRNHWHAQWWSRRTAL